MEHPDIELLTQFALDDPLALDAATLVHITDCEQCGKEIEQIQRVVDATLVVGGRPDLRSLVAPPAHVWDRIEWSIDAPAVDEPARDSSWTPATAIPAQTGESDAIEQGWLFADDPGIADDAPDNAAPGVHVAHVRSSSSRSTGWQLLAAAVVGLVLGAGVTWVLSDRNDAPETTSDNVATSTLSGFDGHDAGGELQLVQTASGSRLDVDFDSGDSGKGFVQVWLLNEKTGGMVALGVLDGDQGSFAVPPGLDLQKYNQVDVSREPFDGDPAHSAISLARGPVPS